MSRDLIGPLYLGVAGGLVPELLRPSIDGVRSRRRAREAPVWLWSCFARAYESAAYEQGGIVMEVWLRRECSWRYLAHASPLAALQAEQGPAGGLEEQKASRWDADRYDDGRLWRVKNSRVIALARRLRHKEAIPLLCQALNDCGPAESFTGTVGDYASIWWKRVETNPRLAGSLRYRQRLEAVLRRHMDGQKVSPAVRNLSAR